MTTTIILIVIGAIIALIFLGIIFSFIGTWVQAWTSGAPVTFRALIGMKLRKVPPSLIVGTRVWAPFGGRKES